MPRHDFNKPQKADRDRALAFHSACERARDQANACEESFERALAAASDMVRWVGGPQDAASHLEIVNELRRLVRRIQRRLDSN